MIRCWNQVSWFYDFIFLMFSVIVSCNNRFGFTTFSQTHNSQILSCRCRQWDNVSTYVNCQFNMSVKMPSSHHHGFSTISSLGLSTSVLIIMKLKLNVDFIIVIRVELANKSLAIGQVAFGQALEEFWQCF